MRCQRSRRGTEEGQTLALASWRIPSALVHSAPASPPSQSLDLLDLRTLGHDNFRCVQVEAHNAATNSTAPAMLRVPGSKRFVPITMLVTITGTRFLTSFPPQDSPCSSGVAASVESTQLVASLGSNAPLVDRKSAALLRYQPLARLIQTRSRAPISLLQYCWATRPRGSAPRRPWSS